MFCDNVALTCAAMLLAAAPVLRAQSEDVERFTFTVRNAPKTALGEDRLDVRIDRWATDGERDRVAAALAEKDPAAVAHTLRNATAAGYIRLPGGLEYTIRYARRVPRPGGGTDLILVSDSRVWVWWDAGADTPVDTPFTAVHVRLDKNGVGEGRLAPASSLRSDKTAGVVVSDLETWPVLLTDFRAQRG